MQIKSTNQIENLYLKVLGYGAPGSRKTRFAGSMARRFKTLILSAEAGLLSIIDMKDEHGNPVACDYITIEKFEDIEEAYNELRAGSLKGKYQAVALDSITEIQKACKDWIMAKSGKDMEQRDWGTLAMRIERMVRAFRDLPMHVVITALEDTETDKSTGEVKVMPALQGSVQKQLPAYFDEVFYFFGKEVEIEDGRKEIKGHILTRNSGKYIGKDRSGKLPAVIADPDFGKVYDMIFPKKEEPSAKKANS